MLKKKVIELYTRTFITDKIDDKPSTFFRFCPVHIPGQGCQSLEKSGIQGEVRDFKGVREKSRIFIKIHISLGVLLKNYKGLRVFHFAWL